MNHLALCENRSHMRPMDLSHLRPNVGIVLISRTGQVWLGRRAKTPAPDNWQFPQGGIDPGEDLETAARRELFEETGAKQATFLGRTEGWVAYDFPPGHRSSKAMRGWRGQKQVWFAFRFEGVDADIDLMGHPPAEFDAWRWAFLEEAAQLIVPFKKAAYERVVEAFGSFAATRGRG